MAVKSPETIREFHTTTDYEIKDIMIPWRGIFKATASGIWSDARRVKVQIEPLFDRDMIVGTGLVCFTLPVILDQSTKSGQIKLQLKYSGGQKNEGP